MKALFKDLQVGQIFRETSTGSGYYRGIESSLILKKKDKSSAVIVAVTGQYNRRHIGGTQRYSAYSVVGGID